MHRTMYWLFHRSFHLLHLRKIKYILKSRRVLAKPIHFLQTTKFTVDQRQHIYENDR